MIIAQLIGLSYGRVPQYGRYVTSVVLMYAVGYPIGHTAVLGAFSKIQKSGIVKSTKVDPINNDFDPAYNCKFNLGRWMI